MNINGIVTSSFMALSCESSTCVVMPFFRAMAPADCITGPSARGSLKGMPTSTKSMPWRSMAFITSAVPFRVGQPAQKYKLSSFLSPRLANTWLILFIAILLLFVYIVIWCWL